MTEWKADQTQDDDNASLQATHQSLVGLTAEVRRLRELLERLRLDQYTQYLLSTRRLAWIGFFYGIMNGLGGAIGATLMLGLLIYILSRLEVVPYIGKFVREIIDAVKHPP